MVDDVGLPLDSNCPVCADCWAPFSSDQRPEWGEAAVSVPWVGPRYFDRRVCAVAINQNAYGGLGGLWWIINGALIDFDQGKRHHRDFQLHTGEYIASIHASLDGTAPARADGAPALAVAADAWRSCAFLEAVKCAPIGDRSKPSAEMWSNCPPRYLRAELEILEPNVLLVIGHDTWETIKSILPITGTDWGESFWRARSWLVDRPVDVFFVNHPAYGHWRHSLPSLLASLERQPIGADSR
jgi:hypothetical protein